jgi:hypothetical protein
MIVGTWDIWMKNPVGSAAVARRKLIFGLGQDLTVTIQHESLPWGLLRFSIRPRSGDRYCKLSEIVVDAMTLEPTAATAIW